MHFLVVKLVRYGLNTQFVWPVELVMKCKQITKILPDQTVVLDVELKIFETLLGYIFFLDEI